MNIYFINEINIYWLEIILSFTSTLSVDVKDFKPRPTKMFCLVRIFIRLNELDWLEIFNSTTGIK